MRCTDRRCRGGTWRVTLRLKGGRILAIVEFTDSPAAAGAAAAGGEQHRVYCVRRPFDRSGVTPDFNGTSVSFPIADLLARAEAPR